MNLVHLNVIIFIIIVNNSILIGLTNHHDPTKYK